MAKANQRLILLVVIAMAIVIVGGGFSKFFSIAPVNGVSQNWAGYVVGLKNGYQVTRAEGSIMVPKLAQSRDSFPIG